MDIGEKIAYYRNSLNLTQSFVAQQLGISRSAVNAWEMGFSTPQLKHVVELAKVFNVTLDSLVSGDSNQTVVDISDLTTDEQAVILQMVACLRNNKSN